MQLTDSYGADQHFLWLVVTAIVLFAVVFMVAIMMVRLASPGWERIVKRSPALFAAGHFQVSEQASVKLGFKTMRIAIESHQRNRLPPVAERFLPFFLVRSGISASRTCSSRAAHQLPAGVT